MEVLHLAMLLANIGLAFRLYAKHYLVPLYIKDHTPH